MPDCGTTGSHGYVLGLQGEDQQHHVIHFPVMDQTSLIWRKKIKAIEKVEPQSPIYALMTTTKYLHALDILY